MSNERTPLFLMANLGSEMTRLLIACESKDMEKLRGASSRAEKMLSEIEDFDEMQSRKDELEKIRYIIKDCNEKSQKLFIDKKSLESYFVPFALRLVKQN